VEAELKAVQDAIANVGAAVVDLQAKKAALHAAIDNAVLAVGQKVAADTQVKPGA